MTYLFPHELRQRRRRRLLWAAAWLAAAALACLLDRWVWSWITMADGVEKRDWWQFLRAQGYLGTWLALGLAVDLVNRARPADDRRPGWPGLAALLSAASAGALAEILKLILARDRPGLSGEHVWHGLFSGFGSRPPGPGLGLPSSHAAVAFGGAFLLARAYPPVRFLVVALACGCGLSRMLAGAHFLSDTVLAAALGAMTAALFAPLAGRPRP